MVCKIQDLFLCQELYPDFDFSDDSFCMEDYSSDTVKSRWTETFREMSVKKFSELSPQLQASRIVEATLDEELLKKEKARQNKNRKKKIRRKQKSKNSMEQQAQVLTCIVSEICDRVAEECAIFDIAAQQSLAGLLDDLCHTVATETAKENERLAPLMIEELVESLAAEVVAEAVNEASSSARQAVLRQAIAGALPLGFARELAAALLPCLEPLLAPAVECFVCLAPLDLAASGVCHLACCDGGSFACAECVASHAGHHPPVTEFRIVCQAAAIRRQLGFGELGRLAGEQGTIDSISEY